MQNVLCRKPLRKYRTPVEKFGLRGPSASASISVVRHHQRLSLSASASTSVCQHQGPSASVSISVCHHQRPSTSASVSAHQHQHPSASVSISVSVNKQFRKVVPLSERLSSVCLSVCLFVTLRKSTTFRKVYWSVPFVTLRKSTTFRKVYWSVPFVCLSVCLSVCLLLCESPKGVFAKYIGQYRLSVCLSVCYFAKARRAFSQSILVSTVCVSVCLSVCLLLCESPKGVFAKYIGQYRLSVCLFVCLSVTHPTGHSFAPIKIIFLPSIRHTQLTLHFLFFLNRPKVKVKVTKNHENNYLSHNF